VRKLRLKDRLERKKKYKTVMEKKTPNFSKRAT
jgi:hypothetical protein